MGEYRVPSIPRALRDGLDLGAAPRELVVVFHGQKAGRDALARHAQVRRRERGRELLEEALELHRRSTVDLLLDLVVGPVEARALERLGAHEERVRVEDPDGRPVEVLRQTELFEHLKTPLRMHRNAPLVPRDLVADLHHHVFLRLDEGPQDGRVDRGAEVVEVGDPDVLAAGFAKFREEAGAAERVDEIAVARGVGARAAVVFTEERALGRQAEAEILREAADLRRRVGRLRASATIGVVGRVARHEPERHGAAGALARARVLGEAEREERLPWQRFDERLHDAPHPRRHASGHHAERELAARDRARAERDSRSASAVPATGASTISVGGAVTGARTRFRSCRARTLRRLAR